MYNIDDTALSCKEMCEELSIEHAKITVTIDKHPYLNNKSISVHPCKHSNIMKKLIKIELEKDEEINVEKYFIFFLKFVSCIIPTVDFDFTTL